MIGSSHSQLCKKNNCSVKLQGGPLDHNPVENSWIIILRNNSKCLLLNDKQMLHEILFSLLQKQSSEGVRKYKVSGNFIKKETLAQVFYCQFCEISKNTFFYRTPPVAASVIRQNTKHKKRWKHGNWKKSNLKKK